MPVIGTAGHVDHGKTALIAALTGMDTDRLPEEKARGMTTDLGFAHFSEGGMTVGVIDVPGHERYIRNMVAGASGIDGAILVVAADDGWMEQTGRHAAVLRALDVPILVVAITKSAIVPPDRPQAVAEDVRSRLAALRAGTGARMDALPWIAVDSITGTGIGELRELLPRLLVAGLEPDEGGARSAATPPPAAKAPRAATPPPAANAPAANAPAAAAPSPFIFVDRAFKLTGTGQVVAGSLRGGPLSVGDEVLLLPAGEMLRVRSLQRYGEPAAQAEPGCRVALTFLKSRALIKRGDCLAGRSGIFIVTASFYLALDAPSSAFRPRPGLIVEIASGTTHIEAQAFPSKTAGFLRLSMDGARATAFVTKTGQPVVILRKGGADILASGKVFIVGGGVATERLGIESALPAARTALPSLTKALVSFELARSGCLRLAADQAAPAETETAPADAEIAGEWLFAHERWEVLRRQVEEAAAEPGGCPVAALAGRLRLPAGADKALILRLEDEKRIVVTNGRILPAGASTAADATLLPKNLALLAESLERSGALGLDVALDQRPGLKKDLALLCRAGRAASLDGRLFLSTAAYAGFVKAILRDRNIDSPLSLGEAKTATGLSRKWIIPLLNRMEDEGYLRRRGEERIVLREGPH